MPHFFENHPITLYDLHKKQKPLVMTNLTVYFKLQEILADRTTVLYQHFIQDGERPDVIAKKAYDDSSLDWIIFLTNNIVDPRWDWPLPQIDFQKYVISKYGSISAAQAQNHHYEFIAQELTKVSRDGVMTITPEIKYEIDLTTYNATTPTKRRAGDSFTYEDRLNEEKRNIKILNSSQVQTILTQAEDIFD